MSWYTELVVKGWRERERAGTERKRELEKARGHDSLDHLARHVRKLATLLNLALEVAFLV